jgi:hypothetical protein
MKHFSATMLAFGIMLAAVPAFGFDTNCTGPMAGTTVDGNLTANAGCTLSDVTVTGNVKVETGAVLGIGPNTTIDGNLRIGTGATLLAHARLFFQSFLTVHGNVVADKCVNVVIEPVGGARVHPVKVDGNVDIQNCSSAAIAFSQINGNVNCSNNSGPCALTSDIVNGNVQINSNGSGSVGDTTIGGNLQCKGNTGGVTNGGGNTVGGHAQGQCAGF